MTRTSNRSQLLLSLVPLMMHPKTKIRHQYYSLIAAAHESWAAAGIASLVFVIMILALGESNHAWYGIA